MPIEWHKVDELPTDKQDCILYNDEQDAVIGPFVFRADMGGWLDLFATEEAGHLYMPGRAGGPTHWAIWNAPEVSPDSGAQ